MEAVDLAVLFILIAEVEPPLLFLHDHGLASASLPEAASAWYESMPPPPAAPGGDHRPQSAGAKLVSGTALRDDDDDIEAKEPASTPPPWADVDNNDDASSASGSSASFGGGVSSSDSGDVDGNDAEASARTVPWRGRPSWLAEASRPRPEELLSRRKTDPCDYRNELLWQPYDCRSRSSSPEDRRGGAATSVPLHSPQPPLQCAGDSGRAGTMAAVVRTFTSTEAQTDDLPPVPAPAVTVVTTPAPATREQRRRERRQRRRHPPWSLPPSTPVPVLVTSADSGLVPPPGAGDRLPDLLHSHLPPPYSTLPLVAAAAPVPVPVAASVPPQVPPPTSGIRFPFQISPTGRRRSRRHYTGEEEPKSCCGVVVTQTVSIRWFIVMIAFVGVCCAVVGTVLGAMKASGREHLTVSLLMIGVGIVLVTVSAVAWRLTAHDAPSCRSMLGLGGGDGGAAEPNRRFVPRLPPSYGRPHHPYAAMMYPEFQYRAPPPSYQASMQEYRLRLLLLDRQPQGHAVSPPPTYRSHSGSTFRAPLGLRRETPSTAEYSRPPSYRSRTSSTRPTLDPGGGVATPLDHSREASLSESTVDSGKVRLVFDAGAKDANLVTIVQTEDSPVIVTVSGSTPIVAGSSVGVSGEMEILAHL